MKKNTHIELNMKSTWIIDFQLTHMLRGAHTFSPNSVKPELPELLGYGSWETARTVAAFRSFQWGPGKRDNWIIV